MVQRLFIPGSEWVYVKIYTGAKTADKLLSHSLFLFIKELKRNKLIKKWFFIRYVDEDFHLRLRLLAEKEDCVGIILSLFANRFSNLIEDGVIWKIQLDTYNRELERYGNSLIEISESFFCLDSECALFVVRKINGYSDENYRWMIALKMVDKFMTDMLLDTISKQNLTQRMAGSFKKEFGFNEYNSKQLNSLFRSKKKVVESVLRDEINDRKFADLCCYVEERSKKLKPLIDLFYLKISKEENVIYLFTNYIHMMLNRLFCSRNRLQELVIYDFMNRFYCSEIAKEKYNRK